MSGPIQTIPQGLLGLLQLKQLGKNPFDLTDSVQSILDIFPLYVQRLSNSTTLIVGSDSLALATGNIGNRTFVTAVPQGQAWYIERMSIDATMAAADFIRLAPSILYEGAGAGFCVAPDTSDAITARGRRLRTAAGGFWAPPGATFGVYVFDILAGTTIATQLFLRGFAVPI